MPSRSLPHIEADLIRLADRTEQAFVVKKGHGIEAQEIERFIEERFARVFSRHGLTLEAGMLLDSAGDLLKLKDRLGAIYDRVALPPAVKLAILELRDAIDTVNTQGRSWSALPSIASAEMLLRQHEATADAALIEEARLVVRQATRDAPPLTAPAPTNAWTLFTMVLGLVAASAMLTFDINPITVALITGGIWYGTSYSINSWSRK